MESKIYRIIIGCFLIINSSFLLSQINSNWILVKEDTFVDSEASNQINGDNGLIKLSGSSDGSHQIIYLKFSLENTDYEYAYPEDIAFVHLKLSTKKWTSDGENSYPQFQVYEVDDNSWTESTLNWENQPWNFQVPNEPIKTFDKAIDTNSTDRADSFVMLDLTEFVKEKISQEEFTFSLVLADTSAGDDQSSGTEAIFLSKECSDDDVLDRVSDSLDYPYLVINENPRFIEYDRIKVAEDTYSEIKWSDQSGGDALYGYDWQIRVRSDDNWKIRISYLKFLLDSLEMLSSQDIERAFLQFTVAKWFNQRNDEGLYSKFAIYPISDTSWDQSTLTWNNQPWNKQLAEDPIVLFDDTLTTDHGIVDDTDPPMQMAFDITEFIKEKIDFGEGEFSLVFSDTSYGTEDANGTDLRIFSKECYGHPETIKNPAPSFIPSLFIKKAETQNLHDLSAPETFQLSQNYPNPFNASTTISYSIKKQGPVYLSIYDLNGRKVKNLIKASRSPGRYEAVWNGKMVNGQNAPTGMYFCKLITTNNVETIKMMLIK